MALYPNFKKFILDHDLLENGDHAVLAVSGGVDSMVLLHLIHRIAGQLGLNVTAAHVNHMLRGKESDKDEILVRGACKRYGTPCEVLRKRPAGGKNLQDSARTIRYDFLKKTAAEHRAGAVATAHHADDQVETMLLHLIRGAGLRGLSGISPSSEISGIKLIRPVLFASKFDIEGYAREQKIKFRTDATNLGAKYSRNAVRLELIPLLKKFNPRIVEVLAIAADRFRADDDALDEVAREAFIEAKISAGPDEISFKRSIYVHLPAGLRNRLLRLAFERLSGSTKDLNADQIKRMDEIAMGQKGKASYRLPSPWKFHRENDLLFIRKSARKCDR